MLLCKTIRAHGCFERPDNVLISVKNKETYRTPLNQRGAKVSLYLTHAHLRTHQHVHKHFLPRNALSCRTHRTPSSLLFSCYTSQAKIEVFFQGGGCSAMCLIDISRSNSLFMLATETHTHWKLFSSLAMVVYAVDFWVREMVCLRS